MIKKLTEEFDDRIPYVYRIKKRDTGEFYYGSKYGKNANPVDFWKTYFTSSKTVKKLIEFYGKDSFDIKIILTSKNKKDIFELEKKLIDKTIKSKKSLNGHSGGTCADTNKGRKIKNPYTGLSSYDIGSKKFKETLKNNPDIKINASKKFKETLKNNPDIIQNAIKKRLEKLDVIKENGKSLREMLSLNIKGDNNPAKRQEVKNKISNSLKLWYNDNPNEVAVLKEKIRLGMIENDCYKRQSNWMLKHNPTTESVWVNDGTQNLRVKENNIPIGFVKGRLKNYTLNRKLMVCPICNFSGKGPNMKRYHFDNCKQNKN